MIAGGKGVNRMKNYMIAVVLLTVITSTASHAAATGQASNHEVKCHVELYGGKEAIYFGLTSSKDLKAYGQSIVGKKISVAATKGKKSVYKVFECVAMTEQFTSRQARTLDSKTLK